MSWARRAAGSARAEAVALQQEGVSLNRIGQLFGVSRQRASVLVREKPLPSDESA